jgi:hypothetical protein
MQELTRSEVFDRKVTAFLSQRARAVLSLSQIYSEHIQVADTEHLFFALVDLHTTKAVNILQAADGSRSCLLSDLGQFDVPRKSLRPPQFAFLAGVDDKIEYCGLPCLYKGSTHLRVPWSSKRPQTAGILNRLTKSRAASRPMLCCTPCYFLVKILLNA